MLVRIVTVGIAGAAGTMLRWGLQHALHETSRFPAGTFIVNLVGCLLYGICWSTAETHGVISPTMRTVLFTGFLGAFTTFSTLVFESQQLARSSEWILFAFYGAGQLIAGFTFLGAGLWIGRMT